MNILDYKDFILAILSVFSTYMFFLLQQKNEKIKNIESQLSDKKYKVYHELFTLYFDLIKNSKTSIETSEEDLILKLIDIKKDIMIYAPDIVLEKFNAWNNFVGDNPNNLKHISLFLELLVLIRKDMGNPKSNLNSDKLLRSIMSSNIEFEKFKKSIN